ncbi:MAG: glycoside hydrolase family 2, partial [Phycisphaerales bacterium]|nr:glycoside hydrolase family 2 [Phycisphaerales bacterium]
DMGWLRRTFAIPVTMKDKRLFLHFEAVAGQVEILINGKKAGEHFDLFLPFDVDITDAVKDGENELLVGVRRGELFSHNSPYGKRAFVAGSMWGESIAGIWQDVYLHAVPAVRVDTTLVQPLVSADTLQADVTLQNDTDQEQHVEVAGAIQPWVNLADPNDTLAAPEPKWRLDPAVMELPAQSIAVPAHGAATVSVKNAVGGKLKLWSPEAPNLYGLTLAVRSNGNVIDQKFIRFGYRQFTIDGARPKLNGKEITFKGDAWHFLGVPQMTRRYAWAWYKAAKAANLNTVRLHAQPYPGLYLEMADETGMMVLDETGIWGSGGTAKFVDSEYWKAADRHVHDFVMRDRNHPSVMGWSAMNEVLVLIRIQRSPPETKEMALKYYAKWVADIAKLDPTRAWVSGDGEEGADGTLPIVIGHYGGTDGPRRWSQTGKPWGVGESGMAYYGTPKQVSQYNGPFAYESMEKRLEGTAVEAYELITKTHLDFSAAYSSVFNLVWYGLQPLEIGLRDTSRAPRVEDGVHFGPFVEGRPGMQPERLGPYCTTLNPGYDPALPLYRKWAMFDAIAAANAPGKPAPSEWSKRPATQPIATPGSTTKIDAVEVLTDGGKTLQLELQLMGVTLATDVHGADARRLLVIDGGAPPKATNTKGQIDATLDAGGTVLVWRPTSEALSSLNALLPAPLELTKRTAVSLVKTIEDPLTAGITNADTYFAELKPDQILDTGLAGPLVGRGKVLLAAPAVDWRVWNNRPEVIKTGSVTRSERETKPDGAALVVTPVGNGRIVIANLSNLTATPERVETARKLLTNLGITLGSPRELITGGVFTNAGTLRRALFIGRFDGKPNEMLRSTDHADLPDGPVFNSPSAGMAVGERKWTEGTADPASQLFDLGGNRLKLPGSNRSANAYVSFWVNSPRALDDVLGQPDVPHVDLLIQGSEHAAAAWLNGKLLKDAPPAEARGANQLFPALVLQRGWNHIMLKLYRGDDEWKFGAQLRCSDPTFLSTVQATLESPAK